MNVNKRDLCVDLAICDAATAGPWAVDDNLSVYHEDSGGTICDVGDPYPRGLNKPSENMRFIAEARTGWPHAIERALAAEAEVERLRDALIAIKSRCSGNPSYTTAGGVYIIATNALKPEVGANV